jgi:hypothetical protein
MKRETREERASHDSTICDGARRARLDDVGGSGGLGRDTHNRLGGKERWWGSELPPPYEVRPGCLYMIARLGTCAVENQEVDLGEKRGRAQAGTRILGVCG